MVLVTGAAGQVGAALVRHLRSVGLDAAATDARPAPFADAIQCDLSSAAVAAELFRNRSISAVVHLAAVLPTAFRADPLRGAEVNLGCAVHLIRAAFAAGVRRFVFASSASVYGGSSEAMYAETSAPSPEDPYGAAKLAVEKVLEYLAKVRVCETVSLRIARVLGPGATETASPWRSQIFEPPAPGRNELAIPFDPEARLTVVHIDDLVRVFRILLETPKLARPVYNAPAEPIVAGEIGRLAESKGWRVSMGMARGGPGIDGTRFTRDFGFATRPIREHIGDC